MTRCPWATTERYVLYHDTEWGVPVHDDRLLFEFLVLEGAQAGLSWETILNKRDNYREAFNRFDPAAVAEYGPEKRAALLANPGIVRNRLKVEAAVRNAKAYLAVQDEFGSFDRYVWQFVGGRPKQNAWKSLADVPARTPESDAMSRDLKRRDFTFVGSTICYAFMQAVGMVNDHLVGRFRHAELSNRGTEGPMAYSEPLAARIRRRLARRKGVEEKKMFGGVGFLLNGNMLVGVWKDSLIVRLGPEQAEAALREPHVREFDITGRPMTGWAMVAPGGVEGDGRLDDWIGRAVTFVRTLPAK
jgi:DNA-3-methyladenine glycosylase I